MLTKSATLMPAADLPPSEARGRYRGLLTKSKRAGTRQKRKSKIWRVRSTPNRAQAHARKEKARFGVCGANPNRAQAHAKKEKARFGVCGATPIGHRHTPEKKKQDLTCAEPSQTPSPKLQDEIFCKSVNLTQNYLLYKQAEA